MTLSAVASALGVPAPRPRPHLTITPPPTAPPTTARPDSGRPRDLSAFIGQETLRLQLGVLVTSARNRGVPPDHSLFSGPPGLGKTSLAQIIATEMGSKLHETTATAVKKVAQMGKALTKLEPNDVLFIDECHRLSGEAEELLGLAMEDRRFVMPASGRSKSEQTEVELPPFTVVGATTRAGSMTGPLRDRFGFVGELTYYSFEELAAIVSAAAPRMALSVDTAAAERLAELSRGTPRIALKWLRRVRDYAETVGAESVTVDVVCGAMELAEVDSRGLTPLDLRVLHAVCVEFVGGPIGLAPLAAFTGEDTATITEVVEPFLVRSGLIRRGSRGRVATRAAYEHLGLSVPVMLGW
jgi:holliday junction DNA helicase RuvB